MKGKIFVDTNVLLYLLSSTEPSKKKRCLDLVTKYDALSQLVWSTQVIQEYIHVLSGKFEQPLAIVKSSISFFQNFELVVNDLPIIEKAMDLKSIYNYSFWDSLILSSAILSKCSFLLSEDLQGGQLIEGLKIVNPFDLTE